MSTFLEQLYQNSSPRLDDAREWLEKCSSGNVRNEGEVSHTCNAERLDAITEELLAESELICGILELCGLQRKDSKQCLKLLIDELQFYRRDNWAFLNDPSKESAIGPVKVDWLCPLLGKADIPLCGRIFAPFLRLFYVPKIITVETHCFPFWKHLSTICTKHGFPLKIDEEKNKIGECNISGGSSPYLIFETADLFSASQSVIENVWSYYGKSHWSPTHIYVQESKFDEFVNLLDLDASNFTKLMGLDSKKTFGESSDLPFSGNLKIIQPSDYNHFKFLVGWDPQFLDWELKTGAGVTILPFRTVDECVKAVNSSSSSCASIWTENAKLQSEVPSLLKAKTVWVNCHGVLDSNTPFGSGTQGIPMNGPELFEWLSLHLSNDHWPTADIITWGSTNELSAFVEGDIASVLKKSLYSLPSSLKINDRISVLRPLHCFLQNMQGFFPIVTISNARIHTNDSGLVVKSKLLPYNWIIVSISSLGGRSELILDEIACLVAIYYGILYGNRVILYGKGDSLKHIQSCGPLKILATRGLLAFVNSSSPIPGTALKGTNSKVISISVKNVEDSVENCLILNSSNYAIFPLLKHLFTSSQDVLFR